MEKDQIYKFGGFQLDPLHRKLFRPDGEPVALKPKIFETLLFLVEHAGALLSKTELLEAVWGDRVVEENSLNQHISKLRRTFGETPGDNRFILTVPARGYRFVAGVTTDIRESVRSSGATEHANSLSRAGDRKEGCAYTATRLVEPQESPQRFDSKAEPKEGREETRSALPADRRVFAYLAVSLVSIAVGSLGFYLLSIYLPSEQEVPDTVATAVAEQIEVAPNSVAVLPFLVIGESAEGRIFSEGLTEDVLDRLARLPGLRVAARSDAFSLPPRPGSQQVRSRLRVAYYLEGSVRIVGDSVRVVVRLIDSANGFNLLSRSFDRDLQDFFALQDEITRLTVANLRVALPHSGHVSVSDRVFADNTEDLDAYVLYRRGLNALYESWTRATMAMAVDAFESALELDPDYAAAYAGICRVNVSAYKAERESDYISSAEEACGRALALNGNLDVVHGALGELYNETGRYEDAESAFLRALDINDNAVSALIGLGTSYEGQGRHEDAEQVLRSATGLQPGNWRAYNSLGLFYFRLGRFNEAGEQYRAVVSLDVNNATGWTNLGGALSLSGRFGEALPAFERAVELEPVSGAFYSNLALIHYYLGDLSKAKQAAQTGVDLTPSDFLLWSNLGDILVNSGDNARAREAFRTAERLAENELDINNRVPQTLAVLSWIKTMLGKSGEAGRLLTLAGQISDEDPYLHYIEALILLHQGHSTAALDELETAVEMGFPIAMIVAEPHLASLHAEPGFADFIE